MAAGSPTRRSSRARSTNNSSSHHDSSTSSTTSTTPTSRSERHTRANTKTGSPTKSALSDSLSSDSQNDALVAGVVEDMLQTRHRKRGEPEDGDKAIKDKAIEMSNGSDDAGEDDEAVRCICGYDEYPGVPPPSDEDTKGRRGAPEPDVADDDLSEDLAGFFLQCDTCKVWQHGGCVGIKNADMSPDEYFCEECRKDLHKIFTAPNGQRYSNYLPLHPNISRNSSRAVSLSKDGTKSPKGKNGRGSASLQGAKRRSTMNSRDAAYDEEEQMRRALEASMKEKSGTTVENNLRRGKRGRSDSEEKPEIVKRQRTASNSPPPSQEQTRQSSNIDSDDGSNDRSSGSKKIRGAAARNHKEKEAREERERLRAEAANKRKGRADRRRGDDSDPSDEAVVVSRSAKSEPAPLTEPVVSSQAATPDTPPSVPPTQSNPQRKGGRPPNARRGKPGRNQYTKDRDETDESPNRAQSRDGGREDGANTRSQDAKAARGKGSLSSKITMHDMKRRVAAILTYISRIQIEMAGESQASSSNGEAEGLLRLVGDSLPMIKVNGDSDAKDPVDSSDGDQQKDFKDLSILEMMDYLTRELVKWQNQYT